MNRLRQHKERVEAEARAKRAAARSATVSTDDAGSGANVTGSAYEQRQAQMAAHVKELSAIASHQTRNERKAELIPDYTPYVEGVLAANEAVQDDIVMSVFIWALDALDWDLALKIAEWALTHDIAPPPQFTRSTATILAEQMAEGVLGELDSETERDEARLIEALFNALIMVEDQDIPDPVRAKLNKAYGYAVRETDPAQALEHLKTALSLHKKIGVKRDIETLERDLKKAEKGIVDKITAKIASKVAPKDKAPTSPPSAPATKEPETTTDKPSGSASDVGGAGSVDKDG